MKRLFFEGKARFVFIPIFAAAAISLVSIVVMLLWNNILPNVLHVTTITFWQAMGIFILCKILFGFGKGGGRFGNGGAPWMMKRRMHERLKNMSPEQREKFKKQMKDRMCNFKNRGWGDFDWEQTGDESTATGTTAV